MSVGGLFEIPGDTYQKSYLSNLLAKHSPQILVGRWCTLLIKKDATKVHFFDVQALKCTFLITYDVQALKKIMILIWHFHL